jgi:hypothetical protein
MDRTEQFIEGTSYGDKYMMLQKRKGESTKRNFQD